MAEIGRLSRFPRDFLERLKEKLCRQKVACGCMKLAQEGEKVQAIRIVFRGKVTADKEDVDFQPHDIKAPTTVGSFAAVDPDCLSPVSLTANSLCGYFEVDVAELQNLLEDYPALRASWQLVVDEEELDAAPMESSLGGIGNRRASRVLVLPEDIAQTDEDEERVIKDTLGKRFEGAEEEFLDCLRDILEKRSFTAEEVILAQGDDGTFAILIASGCCTVEVCLLKR
ncbi:unnamed protein product [Effrenium voratum]|nr:unnamed protein product [Effrenium voratum]